jgi:hypothetical protein
MGLSASSIGNVFMCAVIRRFSLVGANPIHHLSLQVVAAKAVYGGNDMD